MVLQCVKGFRLPRTCLHLDMLFFWLAFWYCFQTQFQWLSIFVRSLDRADVLLFFIGVGIYLGMFAGLKFQCFQKKHQKFSSAFYFLFFSYFLFFCSHQPFRLRIHSIFFFTSFLLCTIRRKNTYEMRAKGVTCRTGNSAYIKKIKELTKSQVFILQCFTLYSIIVFLILCAVRSLRFFIVIVFFSSNICFCSGFAVVQFHCCSGRHRRSECVSTEFFLTFLHFRTRRMKSGGGDSSCSIRASEKRFVSI